MYYFMMGRNKALNELNETYCRSICKKVERLHPKPERTDYPAMAVTAELNGFISEAHSSPGYRIKLDTRSYIEKVLGGKVGTHSPITNSNNPIGNCAEQHVSDFLNRQMTRSGKTTDYKQINFSIPMRPRTKEGFPKCKNCKLLFEKIP